MQPDADTDAPQVDEARPRVERRSRRRERRRQRTRRFIERYERRRRERDSGRSNPLWRPVRITTGVLLILAGIAIGWLPGPGFVVLALPGALLLASEVRRAALLMDHLENVTVPRVRRWHARLRGGPKADWVERDPDFWADWCRASGHPMPQLPPVSPDDTELRPEPIDR